MVETVTETIDIDELLNIVVEGAEMIDNIFDGENVVPEPASLE